MRIFSITDVGMVRQVNQDYVFATDRPLGILRNLFVVADGMGGHQAGDYASKYTVEVLQRELKASEGEDVEKVLVNAIKTANREIIKEASRDVHLKGMGTTVVMAYVRPQRFTFANVGDSRLYLFNGESLKLITRDHSFVEELVRSGVITREQAETHPQRNILMRAVGTSPFIKADTGIVEWKDGDIIMLCSDGLHGSMNISLAEEILSSESNLLTACDRLTDAALAAGSSDNVTVVLVKNAGGIGA